MLNVNDLEIRHKKYKLKSYIPYLLIFISLIVISISTIIIFSYNFKPIVAQQINEVKKSEQASNPIKAVLKEITDDNKTKKELITATAVIVKEKIEHKNIDVEKQLDNKQEIIVKQAKTALTPSLDFMRKIQDKTPVYYENINTDHFKNEPPVKLLEEKPAIIATTNNQQKKKEETPVPILKAENKSNMNIERKNDDSDIQHVIKRFQTNNNPALSLFVAKKYYQLGEYDKAYNYALITNEINNNIEDSWIIFAKSLVKLNKKDMAIDTLKKYINFSRSSQAKILHDEILSGKFK
jgi:tetratricopeptide (TPR) repeat protein